MAMATSPESLSAEGTARALRMIAPGRSCDACRRRKIRCDRQKPCGYCARLKSHCSYPEDRPARVDVTTYEKENVFSRLTKVEESLRQLRKGRDVPLPAMSAPQARSTPAGTRVDSARISYGHIFKTGTASRYVDGSMWTSIELASGGMEDELNSSWVTPRRHDDSSIMLFGSLTSNNLSHLHPKSERVFPLWQVYLENVNPVLKLLHAPTTQRQLLQASQGLEGIPSSFEALLFAIYYAAVTSMRPSTANQPDVGERWSLLDKHGSGVEQALAKANFMIEPDLFAVQALVLYLVCARASGHRDPGMICSMTGVAIRLAKRLGYHRDLRRLGASPFEGEMSSRLWWHIVVLDTMSAQDTDLHPTIQDNSFDVPLPHNVDDQILETGMAVDIEDDEKRTEMVFSLRLIETTRCVRQIMFSDSSGDSELLSPGVSLDRIRVLSRRLEELDRRSLDMNTPLCSFTRTFTSVEMLRASMAIKIMQIVKLGNEASSHTEPQFETILEDCLHILSQLQLAKSFNGQRRFIWLVQRHVERDAIAAILYCLGTDKSGSEVGHKTWTMIDDFFTRPLDNHREGFDDARGMLLQKLLTAANERRPE